MEKNVAQLKRSLMGEDPTPLETLGVQRVVAAYLHAEYANLRAVFADGKMGYANNTWARRQEIAEKRYERALKSLKLTMEMLPKTAQPPTTKSKTAPSKPNEQVKTTPAADASCPPSTNGHHKHHEANGNGKTTIVPKANGKPINRLAATTPRKTAVPAQPGTYALKGVLATRQLHP